MDSDDELCCGNRKLKMHSALRAKLAQQKSNVAETNKSVAVPVAAPAPVPVPVAVVVEVPAEQSKPIFRGNGRSRRFDDGDEL